MRLSAPARRKKLQNAALELFAREGFRGTTTLEIARRAGVSEALLFRHFASKDDLYWSVLEEQCAASGGRERLEKLLRSGASDVETFAAIAEDILGRNFSDSRLYRLLLFSALENHQLSERFFRTYIFDYYQTVAAYIRARIKAGRFRRVDPLLSARLFIGMTLNYFLVEELFRRGRSRNLDLKKVSRTAAEVWLAGVVAPAANGLPAHKQRKSPSNVLPLRIPEKAELASR